MNKFWIMVSLTLGFTQILSAQNYDKQIFDQHLNLSDSPINPYLITTENPTKGLVVSVDRSDHLTNAYIIVNNDTILITLDEDTEAAELNLYSTLITFTKPITSFYFYPGDIEGEVTFYFIKAEATNMPSALQPTKKKVTIAMSRKWLNNPFGVKV